MLKLIALRPLNGCSSSALKCLKINTIYYFCNDYNITDDGICLKDEYIRPLPKDFFSQSKSALQINISAIVGMNGDGKSTLIELLMRLINNCAKHYRLSENKDSLLRIDAVKAELYYLLDDVVYCIRETENDKYPSLLKYADVSNHNERQWKKQMTKVERVNRMNELFYTIVSNYSHYAYNTKDFRNEWSNIIQGKEEDMRCWLYYLFHKNDGYRTPLTIHPFRCEGNIDINREKELTMQRLVALYIQEPNPNENVNSFRRIGNKNAEILQLTDIGYSKLQEITIIQYFQNNKSVSSLSRYINQIEDIIKKYDDIVAENLHDNVLEVVEQCLDFLLGENDPVYKKFINDFFIGIKDRRRVFSSRSDLRQLLNSMKKYQNNIDRDIPFDKFAHKYRKYDKLNIKQMIRLRLVYDVMRKWEIPINILMKEYDSLTDVEKCQHYIVYKTINICSIYPEYRDFIDSKDNGWNNIGLVFDNSVIEEVVELIKKDKTHITLKLRQCLNFIKQQIKEGVNIFNILSDEKLQNRLNDNLKDSFFVGFDKLKAHYLLHPFPLDLLPPPIYKTDILYLSEQRDNIYIPYSYLSSGEKQLLNNIGALIYHLRNIDSVTDSGRLYTSVNIILEEIELYFHPEYQRKIVKILIEKLASLTFNHIKKVNITFVTHSPFILSDIPLCNVLFLQEGTPATEKMQENTFGSNIHGLLKNGFFLPSLPIGEFAYDKINDLFERLNKYKFDPSNREQKEWFYSSIMRVGEPYLRGELMKLYNMHYPIRYND